MPSPALTESQFTVLQALHNADAALTQRRIHERTELSLGTVNATVPGE